MKHNRKELERLRDLAANTNPATAGNKRKINAYARVLRVATAMGDFSAVREVIPFTGLILSKRLVERVYSFADANCRADDKVACKQWLETHVQPHDSNRDEAAVGLAQLKEGYSPRQLRRLLND